MLKICGSRGTVGTLGSSFLGLFVLGCVSGRFSCGAFRGGVSLRGGTAAPCACTYVVKPPRGRLLLTSELEDVCASFSESERAVWATDGAAELSRVGGGRLGASMLDDLVVGETVIDDDDIVRFVGCAGFRGSAWVRS